MLIERIGILTILVFEIKKIFINKKVLKSINNNLKIYLKHLRKGFYLDASFGFSATEGSQI